MKFSVIGAGGWGTAMARLLASNGHETVLWVRDPRQAEALQITRENAKYLPGVKLPLAHLEITTDFAVAVSADTTFLAVPSFAMDSVLRRVAPLASSEAVFISLAKGIDRESHGTMSELIEHHLPTATVYALSGPSHAEEVGRDNPTAVVLAGHDLVRGEALQHTLATDRFRVYLSDDLRGVELCATVKNIIALAAGVSDGLGYGDNSRSALVTRGLAELVRFGRAFGAQDKTFFGLSGLGDLVATCTSEHSRNRRVGYRIGRGESLHDILSGMDMVAEGIYATQVVHEMARDQKIDMPITEAVHRLLAGHAAPLELVDQIMTRAPKREGF